MKKKNNNTPSRAIITLREELRCEALALSGQLSRSVARLTSSDAQPCEEYGEEIRWEYAVAEKLFYVQRCREMLERCIAAGNARLRFRWADGSVTETTFCKVGTKRVRVEGLLNTKKERASV